MIVASPDFSQHSQDFFHDIYANSRGFAPSMLFGLLLGCLEKLSLTCVFHQASVYDVLFGIVVWNNRIDQVFVGAEKMSYRSGRKAFSALRTPCEKVL